MNWKLRKAFTGNNTSDVQTINGYIAAGEDNDFSVEVSPVGKEYPAPLVVPRTNLLLQSNQFDTTWTQSDISTLTSGQSGYEGTSDAWLVEKSASSNAYLRQNISSSGVHTFSLYAKSNTLDGVLIQTRGGSNKSAQFNLSTGDIGNTVNNIDAKIEDVGNGWYRCSVSVNDSGITQVRVFICDDGTTVGTTSGSIYIQDAQLEAGDKATEYIPTTTEAVTRSWDSFSRVQNQVPGICNGTHTHTGAASGAGIAATTLTGTGSGGKFKYEFDTLGKLTLIEAMTHENLLLQSNQFDTTWTTSNASVTSGESGYDGSSDAWLLEATTTGTSRSIQQNVSTSGVTVFSVYVKAGTTDWIRMNLSGIGNQYFDIGNGVVGSSGGLNGFITDVGGGWYRCSLLGNGSSTAPFIFLASDDGNLAVNAGDNIYIQDAQLEEGSQATGYIETTTAPVREGAGQGYKVDDKLSITTNEGHDIEFRLVEGSNATTVTVGMEATKPSKPVPFPVTKMRVADSTDRRVLIMDQRSRYVFPKPTPYLLDNYEGAAAAYSLRRLRSAYTGPAVRVRRESNNDELDIYFNRDGSLDTATLETFCAGTNGFVKVWYDQSGSGADLEQGATARQGVIVSAGTILTDADGLPYVNAIVSTYDNPIQINQPFTAFAAAQFGAGYRRLMLGGVLWSPDLTNNRFNGGLNMTGTNALTFANKELYGILANGTSSEMRYNGTSDATGNVGTNAISTSTTFFSQAAPSNTGPERAYEMVIFSGDQSANFTGIETNINDFYNIY